MHLKLEQAYTTHTHTQKEKKRGLVQLELYQR